MLSVIVIVIGTLSAILTVLYAFQQDDWRCLLSFSSAENASIAVAALGAAMLFRSHRLHELAGLAWTVALLHLAGHALAKGTLFLTADGLRRDTGSYHIRQAAPEVTGCSASALCLRRSASRRCLRRLASSASGSSSRPCFRASISLASAGGLSSR